MLQSPSWVGFHCLCHFMFVESKEVLFSASITRFCLHNNHVLLQGSTRSRTQRKRSSVEEGRDGRLQSDVFSSLSKFRENQKTGSKTDSIALVS